MGEGSLPPSDSLKTQLVVGVRSKSLLWHRNLTTRVSRCVFTRIELVRNAFAAPWPFSMHIARVAAE